MSPQQIVQRLIEICQEEQVLQHAPHTDLAKADFAQSGVDSMSLVYLQATIEEEWGVHVPTSHFAAWLRNLDAVAAYIAEQLATRDAPLTAVAVSA